ncbi:MAG: hypothetical protein PWQ35_460 [Patescibacteria group bacterium]|nr:hypothetical protein [Patescibacteria group bacterium]
MKKLSVIFLLFIMTFALNAQFRDNANLSLFGGGYVATQNTNNSGYWYGMYAEYMPIKANGWNLGMSVVASSTSFKSNDRTNTYSGNSSSFGGGLAGGKYIYNLFPKYSGYFGTNLMIKQNFDSGDGKSVGADGNLGTFSMNQKDLILTGEINANFLKKINEGNEFFPRTQIRLFLQKPVKANRTAYWNEELIDQNYHYDNSSFSLELKESIISFGSKTQLEPKLYTGYYRYQGNKSNWFAIGPELALKKKGWDDFLSIYFLLKKQVGNYEKNLNSSQFVFGVNFMPFNIKK